MPLFTEAKQALFVQRSLDSSDKSMPIGRTAYRNLTVPELVEHSIRAGEGALCLNGGLVVRTGEHKGLSPRDRFVVRDNTTSANVEWSADTQPISPERFDALLGQMMGYLAERDVYVRDCVAGAAARYRMPLRIVTEFAWQSLFAANMFLPTIASSETDPELLVVCAPGFNALSQTGGNSSATSIVIDLTRKIALIGGTAYAGEIKKAVFTVLNYLLPEREVLPLQCAASAGDEGDTALFFGIPGAGKTTLSFDPDRRLIGDDEHGWGAEGIFNLEAGCYAKCHRLTPEVEPQICASLRFGTVLENVTVDARTRAVQLADGSLTENTRAAYPISAVDNAVLSGIGGHPKNVLFLTCDAAGVLPPISMLTPEQSVRYFVNGYSTRLPEQNGVGQPQTTFSACYAAQFMPRNPLLYARMLARKMEMHGTRCWLINTGWIGGPYGVGRRIPVQITRSLVRAALNRTLDDVSFNIDPHFRVLVPVRCPGVTGRTLDQRENWSDAGAYDTAAVELAHRFDHNLERFGSGLRFSGHLA